MTTKDCSRNLADKDSPRKIIINFKNRIFPVVKYSLSDERTIYAQHIEENQLREIKD
jgi:hypothetical protein